MVVCSGDGGRSTPGESTRQETYSKAAEEKESLGLCRR